MASVPGPTAGERILLVGAGLGGVRTAEALRRAGHTGAITLLGAEDRPPYDRPPLTKAVLRGHLDDTAFPLDLAAMGVGLRLGARAVGVDVERRLVHLADGTAASYDALVLAPGAVPRRLPGTADLAGAVVVRTLDDALALRAELDRTRRVVIAGGGFIGCEIAASARLRGAEVDLVEALPAPLVRVLGRHGAGIVQDELEARGVRVHSGIGIAEVLGSDRVSGIRLHDGRQLSTELLVQGLGVSPDLDWLAGSGVEVDDGIVCDGAGRTSAPRVWALGDAAAWPHPLAERRRRVEHWTTVTEQAATVARSIVAGEHRGLDAVPYFWSDVFDLKIQALGFVDPAHEVSVTNPGGRTVLLYSLQGRITGAVGFSAARTMARLRQPVAEHAPIDEVLAALPLSL